MLSILGASGLRRISVLRTLVRGAAALLDDVPLRRLEDLLDVEHRVSEAAARPARPPPVDPPPPLEGEKQPVEENEPGGGAEKDE
jgi:hypothetical protein